MNNQKYNVGSLLNEMSKVELGDKRLNRRVGLISEALSGHSGESFPKAFGSEAFIEAFYRILRNPRVNYRELLEPHIKASCERVGAEHAEVLVLHDTTKIKLKPDASREYIGWVDYSKRVGVLTEGFFGHFALAVSADEKKIPLGVIGFEPFRRQEIPNANNRYKYSNPNKESRRWGSMVDETEVKLGKKSTAIHIMDSEGDSYGLISNLTENGNHFVIRGYHNRVLKNNSKRLHEVLEKQTCVCLREVKLASRKKEIRYTKRHPKRESRIAKLGFSSGSVEIERPGSAVGERLRSIQLNVVHVFEIDPPKDVEPIDWKLYTTEPVDTEEQILRIVDFYRSRWMIEEYFKALKTGCGYEKRNLESYETWLNALALLIPVAWQLLMMRELSRREQPELASDYFSQSQLKILKQRAHRKLSENPTVKEAMLSIASLGGHLRSNGPPGWQVIGRGFYDLLMMDVGYQLATAERCDQ